MTNFIATTKLGRRLLATAAATLSLGVFAPGMASPAPAIVNGTSTTINAAPYTVRLQMRSAFTPLGQAIQECGGVLVAQQWVMTAAHCFNDMDTPLGKVPVSELYVSMGKTRLADHARAFFATTAADNLINRRFIHPYYSRISNSNDIAMIKLKSAVPLMSLVPSAIAMNTSATAPAIGSSATVYGWGYTDVNASVSADVLQSGKVITGRLNLGPSGSLDCSRYGAAFSATTQICAIGLTPKGQPIDSCKGDSGGPLVATVGTQLKLIGIVSFGGASWVCGDRFFPGVYTRVSAFVQWANNTMNTNKAL